MLGCYARKLTSKLALRQNVRLLSTPAASFKASDLQLQQCTQAQMKPKPDPNTLVFGATFSDHMLEIEWTASDGWATPVISPFHNFDMHPACKVLHYAVELFEGMKAYRGVDNKVRLFRPDKNAERMHRTAERCAFPVFDKGELVECIRRLVEVDQEWVPYSTTSTLYIRPTMIATEVSVRSSLIATEPSLGVSSSNRCLLYVITGPVGPYYPTGFKPVTLLADPSHVRAWEGGSGAYKMGCNYAPTIHISNEALKQHGCQQVLWLYGPEEQWTEVGAMNVFVYWQNEQGENELVTPPLDQGIILPGVTRTSLIDLARGWGEFKVSERRINMADILKSLQEGRLKEVFGAGTACVVCPVEGLVYKGKRLEIPTMSEGAPVTMRCYNELTDIQYGRSPSKWMVDV